MIEAPTLTDDELMTLSPKQDALGGAIARGKKIILLEGPMGTSKSFACAVACLTVCMEWPGSTGWVCRKTTPELSLNTVPEFREAAFKMGLIEGYHYVENKSKMYFEFLREAKGSFIYFKELNHNVDPQFFKLKGANLSFAFIDEADGVVPGALHMLNGRVGRHNFNGCPDFVMMACNANEGWIKEEYYDKYHNPEKHGPLPKNTEVIEFDLEDSFLSDDYYIKQMGNPKQWVQRYIYNNWNFGDDLYSLFKYRHMDSIHVKRFTRGRKFLAIDCARVVDRTVGAVMQSKTITDIHVFKDTNVEMDYDDQARLIHDYCEAEGIGWQDIWVDAVGEGQALIVSFKTLYGWTVNSYLSNAEPEVKRKLKAALAKATNDHQKELIRRQYPVVYDSLRSEQAFLLSSDIEHSDIHFYDGCPHLDLFKKEATQHNSTDNGSVLKIEPKKKVKERLGHSPDIFDTVIMVRYAANRAGTVGTYAGRNPEKSKVRSATPGRIPGNGRPLTRGWRGAKF